MVDVVFSWGFATALLGLVMLTAAMARTARIDRRVEVLVDEIAIGRRAQRESEDQRRQLEQQTLEARLLHQATDLAAAASTNAEAYQACVDIVCELTGWPVGHVYALPEQATIDDVLLPTGIWNRGSTRRHSVFADVTEKTTFAHGVGLPGRIWESLEPAWIVNVQVDPNFPRNKLASDIGVKGGFGFPVIANGELQAVCEFFAEDEMEPDETLLRMVRSVGAQMGRVLERRMAAEDLAEAMELADAANDAKSNFLANMSHEIRTPMNAVIGMTEMLLETEMTPQQREYLQIVATSADALLLIINDILDFSKIEAGKMVLDPIPCSIADVVADAVQAIAVKGFEKDIEVMVEVDPSLPPSVIADAGRIRQVITNLTGNAIKFTTDGEVMVRASAAGPGTGPGSLIVQIDVRDTGVGIADDKIDHIFSAFEQADGSTTRNFGGTGLGLAISRRFAELMGGTIVVESEENVGSTFRFTIDVPIDTTTTAQRAQPVDLAGRRFVVVDDNETNRRILRRTLADWDVVVDVFTNAADAMRHLRSVETPDLVITDFHMPEMDGGQLVRAIRRDPRLHHIPVTVLTSGGSSSELIDQADRCLLKPVKASELRRSIVDVLTRTNAAVASEPTPASSVRTTDLHPLPPLRILVAEDNLVNQKIVRSMLVKLGLQPDLVGNGLEAIAACAESSYDLVLMDVQMPEMGGFEATERLRAREVDTDDRLPIIALTAHAMADDRQRCLDAGMDDYLTKPLKIEALHDVLARWATRVAG